MLANNLPNSLSQSLKSIELLFKKTTPIITQILERSIGGKDLSESQIINLFLTKGVDYEALLTVGNFLRKQTVGDIITYVVNRNINFTNVCVKRCGFCAFSRTADSQEGYHLPLEEIVRRSVEAQNYGASEVCIQAGLPPNMDGRYYIQLCRAIKKVIPNIHIHAFSPEEILYGSKQSKMTIREYLKELKDAGIGSLPGTSAEILDDDLRKQISPGRISTTQWIEVITTAHSLEIPTSSTLMYGHVETVKHSARHLLLLRDLQRTSGGFTEFVPLSFVHTEAPMFSHNNQLGIKAGPSKSEVLKMHAIARLVLNQDIPNIQVSWVKEGLVDSKECLNCGANDLGGTLMNESISTAAGSLHGQLVRPRDLRRMIRDIGRIPGSRSTLYKLIRRFDSPETDGEDPLDKLNSEEQKLLGSYHELIKLDRFRFSSKKILSSA